MFEEEIEELEMVATDMRGAGEQMQAELDEALPVLRGMYSQTAMNALVDAANAALVAGGFEGDYPEFTEDVTEFPGEFVRLLMMLSDAAAETGAGVQITLDAIEDDRDVAMLASQIQQLAVDEAFAAGMTAGPSVEVDVGIAPGPGGPVVEEEALMMERM
jgi:hypothetical protein|tara:strand:- start:464 stop:943 length:480 start_codon:yes stop_codon:yes gene_type:complete